MWTTYDAALCLMICACTTATLACGDASDGAPTEAGRLAQRLVGADAIELLDDTMTGLVWVNDVRGCFGGVTDPAATSCQELNAMEFGQIATWRMPTTQELSGIIVAVDGDPSTQLHYINPSCGVMTASDGYVLTEHSPMPGAISAATPGNAGVRCVSER